MITTNIIYTLIVLSFLTYFLVSWVYKRLGVTNLQQALLVRNGLRLLNMKHSIGIVLFGILFYMVMPQLKGLIHTIVIPKLHVLLPFIALLFSCAYVSYLSVKNQVQKDIAISDYKFSDGWLYFSIRFVFLFGYEFFFRGVMLYTFLEHYNPFLAILYCTIPYLIIHIFDSRKEIVGTIPFGIILCTITYLTSSIWFAFLMHLALSAVYEISIFYYQTLKTSIS
jgi:membrane protease YdiL (CAAX protease family)